MMPREELMMARRPAASVPYVRIEKGKYVLRKHGLWKEPRKKSRWAEGEYRDGKKHGVWNFWHKNGEKWYEGGYKDGKPAGDHRAWHPVVPSVFIALFIPYLTSAP